MAKLLLKCFPVVALVATTVVALEFEVDATSTAWLLSSPKTAQRASGDRRSHYRLIELPTLGGLQDFANWINDEGWVTGAADLPGGHREHAFLWHDKQMLDLGTLGGRNSLAWPVSDAGDIGGSSETSSNDPYEENYCNFVIDGKVEHSKRTCLGFAWRHGTLTPLPTLGGNNGSVNGGNNRGQLVGDAETGAIDRGCVAPQVFDFEGIVWGPQRHVLALPPFGGDAVSVALAMNDHGQVVGGSGVCAPISPAIGVHALLWQDGVPTYLGGFGGHMNNVAFAINNRGQVAGFSDLPNDATTHAFFWQSASGMKDVGTLPGDFASFAFGINDGGQVVGQSCDASFNCRAFIWQDGVMSDLNTLVSSSKLYLTLAESVNRSGEITGVAYDKASGGIPAYIAIPVRGCLVGHRTSKPILPADVRDRIQGMSPRGRLGATAVSLTTAQSNTMLPLSL